MMCTICRKQNDVLKRMVWLSFFGKISFANKNGHEAIWKQSKLKLYTCMAVAARCSGAIRACMEEQVLLQ